MSHMSQRRINAGQRTGKVGHHPAGLMSHMSHSQQPLMSLMSQIGQGAVSLFVEVTGRLGHVGHHPAPSLT
jgi:hypothetical protein